MQIGWLAGCQQGWAVTPGGISNRETTAGTLPTTGFQG